MDPGPGPSPGSGAGPARPIRILLVEDERLIRMALARGLAASGYEVLSASSAEEALRLCTLRPEHLDLLLADVVLPGVNGVELAERLRALGLDCPVLFMSAAPAEELRRLRLRPEMALLAKPFEKEDLLARLEQLLGAA